MARMKRSNAFVKSEKTSAGKAVKADASHRPGLPAPRLVVALRDSADRVERMARDMREMALHLLTDDHGISGHAFCHLGVLLHDTGNEDLLQHVDATDDRFYMPVDWEKPT